jgi:Mg2+-importing ATPase
MLQELQTGTEGLKSSECSERLKSYGSNVLKSKKRSGSLKILFSQFRSPITLLLLFAAGISILLHDPTDAVIIVSIVLISSVLGFWQEKGAADAFEKLLATVQIKTSVLRDGKEKEISVEEVVPEI